MIIIVKGFDEALYYLSQVDRFSVFWDFLAGEGFFNH